MSQADRSLFNFFLIYLRLGCICFGGPVSHLAYFNHEFVQRRKWLDAATYAELLALCQFIPGPSSSQLCFALGWHRGGILAGGLAWLGFTLPSAVLMIGCAYGISSWTEHPSKLLDGLLIAAVAVVANAVIGLGKKLCPDRPRLLIAAICALIAWYLPGSLTQLCVILFASLIGNAFFRQFIPKHKAHQSLNLHCSAATARACLTLYAALLIGSVVMLNTTNSLALYAHHYRAGALVFAGGHVVLPLLHDSLIGSGLMTEDVFLAGYSSAQALPGPLFTLAAYLGAIGAKIGPAWLAGCAALSAIFLPGILLLVGILPFWNHLRKQIWAQAGLIGANAAVVGLLIAAFLNPVWAHGIGKGLDLILAIVAFTALYRYKISAWIVIPICGLAGLILS